MTDTELLDQAVLCYRDGITSHREKMIRCGQLLHEFVLARLRMADRLNEENRRKAGITRKNAVDAAAARLKISRHYVNELIGIAMVVELLATDGQLGDLSFSAIRSFVPAIRRKRGDKKQRYPGRNVPFSVLEEWEIKPELQNKAIPLFSEAVANSWFSRRIARELSAAMPSGRRTREKEGPQVEQQFHKNCSPGDLAEIVIEMVNQSIDPRTAASALMARLSKIVDRKPIALEDYDE